MQGSSVAYDLSGDHLAMEKVHAAAEEVVHNLSSSHSAQVNLPFIAMDFKTMKVRRVYVCIL
jgi:molecular chaperone DnaK (HSP70)